MLFLLDLRPQREHVFAAIRSSGRPKKPRVLGVMTVGQRWWTA